MMNVKIWRILCAVFLCFVLTGGANSAVIFEDNFDAQPDYLPTQPATGSTYACYGTECPGMPTNWHSYRMQGSAFSPMGENTIRIDGSHPRGGPGKSFVHYGESDGGGGDWASDGYLGVLLPTEQQSMYVRLWIRFQDGWQWATGSGPLQKIFRATHYRGGDPAQFFADGNHGPLAGNLLAKYNGGATNVAAAVDFRYENIYYPDQATPTGARSASYYFPGGNYAGTGPEWAAVGQFGDGDWHCWEMYLQMNSAVGVADGVYRAWADGVLIGEKIDLAWSDVGASVDPRAGWNYVMLGGNNMNFYADKSLKS